MTDKQIIINGIDVSGCSYFKMNNKMPMCRACNSGVGSPYCEYHKDCYYKQLKRKEQACKVLALDAKVADNHLQHRIKMCDLLREKLKAKEQESEELKTMLKDLSYENQKFCYQIEEQTKQLEPFKDEYFKGLDNVAIAELAKKSIRITAENSKLEKALTEIKEIAEQSCSLNSCKVGSCMHCKYLDEPLVVKRILQKISECEAKN